MVTASAGHWTAPLELIDRQVDALPVKGPERPLDAVLADKASRSPYSSRPASGAPGTGSPGA